MSLRDDKEQDAQDLDKTKGKWNMAKIGYSRVSVDVGMILKYPLKRKKRELELKESRQRILNLVCIFVLCFHPIVRTLVLSLQTQGNISQYQDNAPSALELCQSIACFLSDFCQLQLCDVWNSLLVVPYFSDVILSGSFPGAIKPSFKLKMLLKH